LRSVGVEVEGKGVVVVEMAAVIGSDEGVVGVVDPEAVILMALAEA